MSNKYTTMTGIVIAQILRFEIKCIINNNNNYTNNYTLK